MTMWTCRMLLKVLARALALICAKFDTGNTGKPVGVNSGDGDIDDTKLGDEQRRVYNLMDTTCLLRAELELVNPSFCNTL